MFSAQSIAISFITMFAAIGAFSFMEKRHWVATKKIVLAIGLSAAIYSAAAGLFLLSGWHDPLASVNSQEVGQAASSHGGRGGIVILAIRF